MGFLAPTLLALLPLALLPLVIHLLSRLRLRRVSFPSLLLLQKAHRERFSWLRAKEIVLLFLRTLTLLFLLLSLARPYLATTVPGLKSTADLLLILDNSFSMTYSNRWQTAREVTRRLVAASTHPRLILATQPDSIFTGQQIISAILDTIKPGTTPPILTPAIKTAASVIRRTPMPVTIITDLQHRCFPETLPSLAAPITVINLGNKNFSNAGVRRVQIDNHLLKTEIANYGTSSTTRAVRLQIGSLIDEKTITIPARSRTTITFTISPHQPGIHTGTVSITADSLTVDDSRHFVLPILEKTPVLVVFSETTSVRYLELALRSDPSSPFHPQLLPLTHFRRTDLSRYPVVVIADAARLQPGDWDRLFFYLGNTNGAALLIAGEPLPGTSGITRHLKNLGFSQPTGFVSIGTVDTNHPILSIFHTRDLNSTRIFRYNRVTGGKPLVVLNNGDPLILEIPTVRLLIWTFAPLPTATDLVFKAPFAPLVHRTVNYLALLPFQSEYTAGDTIKIFTTDTRPTLLSTPGGEKTVIPQSSLPRPYILLTDTRECGIYRLENGLTFAVNPLPEEGDLTPLDIAQLQKQGITITDITGPRSTDLTGLLLYLAVAALLLELLILALESTQAKMPV